MVPGLRLRLLLRYRPACVLCNAHIVPGQTVYLLDEEAVRRQQASDQGRMPAAAMKVRSRGKKSEYLCCDAPPCRRVCRGAARSVFDPSQLDDWAAEGDKDGRRKRRSKKAKPQGATVDILLEDGFDYAE